MKKLNRKLKLSLFLVLFATLIGMCIINNTTANAGPLKGNCNHYSDGLHRAYSKESVTGIDVQGQKHHMTRFACDCGAEVICDGYPFRKSGPYMGWYSFDYKITMINGGHKIYDMKSINYSDSVIGGWEFHGAWE